jgi:hypothetical protein
MVSRAASAALLLGPVPASLAERGTVNVPRAETPPVVDCRLDDAAWPAAAVLDGFRQTYPGDNAEPSCATEVRLLYTPRALYVAVRAEADPERVRATLAKRDAIAEDDSVSLYLDTFHDRRRAYVLMFNPLGVQQDGVFVEGSEPDFSYDVAMQSAGCVGERGYALEVAVPFESLRCQAGPGRSWGLHVIRQLKHENEEHSWMPLRRDRVGVAATTRELRARFLAQAGTLAGLEAIEHPKLLEWIPVSAARATGRAADLDLGASARLALSPAATADLALNPDFAEVEADQPQSTANQRFPLFFAEKRPFFLEGADLFQTPVRAFHSRSIVDPDAALKLTGTRGRASATALLALDAAPGPGKAIAGALRLRRDVGDQSSLGLLATRRQFGGAGNDVVGLDGRLAVGGRSVWTFQALATRAGETLGFGYYSEWARSDRRTSLQVVGEGYSAGYRAELGYTQRTDTNRWSAVVRYNAPPAEGGPLVSWSAANTLLVQFDGRGRMQYAYVYPRLLLAFPRQGFLNLYAYKDYARVFEEEFAPARSATRPGAFAGRAERSTDYHGFTVEAGTAPSRSLSLQVAYDRSWDNLDYDLGAGRFPRVSPGALLDPDAPLDPGPADYSLRAATLALRPTEALRVSGSYEHGRLTRDDTGLDVFDQRLASLRAHYAFTRDAWLRARLDYDSLDGRMFQQLVFGWTPRPGTALYAGYDETGEWSLGPDRRYTRRDRTLFAKLSWAVRTRLGR